ncbi:MAG: PocR ligand-binding domain-containing protein, partial [Candidatus Aminicenantes bacterium]|nr:PocR ligand-binding domain-containing protein [Candidatus Aminicenantes bacterium]
MTRTELPLVLINLRGEIVYFGTRCTLCEELLENEDSVLRQTCRLKMLKAVEEAFRWGEGYITNCPLGLIMFSVPIVSNKKLIGGFLSGFGIFPEMKKDFVEEISQNLGNFRESFDEMKLKD